MDYNLKYKIASNLIKKGYLIHCTNEVFTSFDSSYIKGGARAKEGYGFYFSDMPYKSIEYGDNWKIIKKDDFNFLKSNTPLQSLKIFNDDILDEIYYLENEQNNVRNIKQYDDLQNKIENLKEFYNEIGGYTFFNSIRNAIQKYDLKTIGHIEYYIDNPNKNIPCLIKLYRYYGFDGYETDGIYTIFNFEKLNKLVKTIDVENYNLNETIDLSSFKIQDELNPKFWKEGKLDSRIRLKLLDIADDFTDFLNVNWVKVKDIIMTGSLSNYNWSEDYSDIDLHIIINYKDVDKRVEFVRDYFNSKKQLWNQEHQNIKIYGFPVELYVQDENEPHASTGVYSLEKNEWIVKPEKKTIPKKNLTNAEKDAESWISKIDNLIDRYYPDATDSQKEDLIDNLDNMFDDIKSSRKKGFSSGGDEMNKNNLTFKMLRRNGYIDKIYSKKNEVYDDLMSINENGKNNIW